MRGKKKGHLYKTLITFGFLWESSEPAKVMIRPNWNLMLLVKMENISLGYLEATENPFHVYLNRIF